MTTPFRPEPFHVATPVKRAPFASADPKWDQFAIQTDLGQVAAVGQGSCKVDPDDLLYSDYHTHADHNHGRIVGSARSGYFHGHYLKGVGRTLLTAHWADADEWYHATGHMMPTSGAREVLVSSYLEGRGFGDAVLRCPSMLVKPLPESMRSFGSDSLHWSDPPGGRPADNALMCVTIKDGDFIRMSNVSWMLDRVGYGPSQAPLLRVFDVLSRHADPISGSTSPATLARSLHTCIERGIRSFRSFFEAGVMWISLHNNFTVDGRFLDLEMPVVVGGPVAGVVNVAGGKHVVGLEVLSYLTQVRAWLVRLQHTLRMICGYQPSTTPALQAFATEFIEELDRAFGPEHVVHSAAARARLVLEWFEAHMDLSPSQHNILASLVTAHADGHHPAEPPLESPVALGSVESGAPISVQGFSGFGGLSLEAHSEATRWKALTDAVDHESDPDAFLRAVTSAQRELGDPQFRVAALAQHRTAFVS